MRSDNSWADALKSVRDVVTFYGFALLVVAAAYTTSIGLAGLSPADKHVAFWVMNAMLFLICAAVFVIAWFKPNNLYDPKGLVQKARKVEADAMRPAPVSGASLGPDARRTTLEAEQLSIALASDGLAETEALLPPVFLAAREKAKQSNCLSNLKQLALAAIMYTSDNNESFPNPEKWFEDLRPYYRSDERILHCPYDADSWGYAMNSALAGVRLSSVIDPRRTVLFFDSNAGVESAHDTGESLPLPGRHLERNVIAFVDGHAEAVDAARQRELKWTPG